MGVDDYLRLGQVSLETAFFVSVPVLSLGLIAGLGVSIFQAATQINDSALAFLPKIVAAMVGLMLFGNFMISKLAAFTIWTYGQIGTVTP